MKKRSKKSITNGKHSFLFWLVVPLVFLWLSIGYVVGSLKDKPLWLSSSKGASNTEVSSPYYQEYAGIDGDLEQPFITFWFDDAWLSQYINAYPVLRDYNYNAAISVPTAAVESQNYMNWAQVSLLANDGWEITNHSISHNCDMGGWDKELVKKEYRNSKLALWKHKLPSDIFVTPCGVDSSVMREEAGKNFIAYRTVDPGYNDPSDFDFYNIKVRNIDANVSMTEIKSWIDYAKENNLWAILVFHRIGDLAKQINDDTFNTSNEDFAEIVAYVHQQDIQVVVPSQILSTVIE
jgi:peptidoglycan/xylan/chitin deacetylase (PgdA/CDA1 family)